jgi:histidinol-phosphate aminotransferase
MRVGFALADAGIIEILDRVRDAYNVDRIAQAACTGCL